MPRKHQIVPELAAAVHGVIEEIPLIPETLTSSYKRRRSESSTSSNSSNNQHVPSLTISSRFISQVDAREAFTYFDQNHDGKLTIKEFKTVMHHLGYKSVDARSIRRIFAKADRNGKKRRAISFDEFVEFLESKSFSPPNNQLTTEDFGAVSLPKMEFDVEALFNCYDLDKNGFIGPKEVRKVMKRLTGERLSKRDIKEMISVGDRNGDGVLDKTEFARLCSAVYY